MTGAPLSEAFSGRSNSFGFLRWLLASLVVVGHAYPLSGLEGGTDPFYDLTGAQESFGGFAVAAFFIISGFLISRSWRNHPRLGRFLWHRALRILPAFWVCLLVTAFVFAPVVWWSGRGGVEGFLTGPDPSAPGYVLRNAGLVMHQQTIGDLLTGTPYGAVAGGVWNGSLWTLAYEFGCYLVVAVLGLLGALAGRGRPVVVLLAVLAWAATVAEEVRPGWVGSVVPVLADPWIARFLFLFLIGSVCALFADRIRIADGYGVLAVAVAVGAMATQLWVPVGYLVLPYVLLWLAVRLPLSGFDRPGDFSYGIYIYAFPVQMLLAYAGVTSAGVLGYAAASLAVTSALAVVSWHLVEKRALRWKGWTPRRYAERASTPVTGERDPAA